MTEPELRDLFQLLARRIKSYLPPETGFLLLATPHGQSGIAQYVSNVRREDAAKWMKETLARWPANDFVARDGD